MQKLPHFFLSLTESSSLLGRKVTAKASWKRYWRSRKCIHSKAALLTLLWAFIAYLVLIVLLEIPSLFYYHCNRIIHYSLVFCAYPIAGHLADIKFGRHNTIIASLWILLIGLIIFMFGYGLISGAFEVYGSFTTHILTDVGLPVTAISTLLLVIGIVGFGANKFQFGLDQLYDSPAEDLSQFIHWTIWTYFAAQLLATIVTSPLFEHQHAAIVGKQATVGFIIIVLIILLIITLCLNHFKRHWFLVEPSRLNPFKLVYQVSKFAYHHKVPVYRSAFTYCEDELPCGLDLGKAKYGGPFTTEQVEDVKVFYGISKVIMAVGLVYFVDIANESFHSLYHSSIHEVTLCSSTQSAINMSSQNKTVTKLRLFATIGVVYPITGLIGIPVYLLLLRPFIGGYLPGPLKRMGIGIATSILALVYTFMTDTVIHIKNRELGCMFDFHNSSMIEKSEENIVIQMIIVRDIIAAVSLMLTYISLYEFICSQSPQSMNGLLIGLSYMTRGLFRVLGSVLIIPFALSWSAPYFPSCGMVYYIVNIAVATTGGVLYIYTAKKYSYRKRDEFCDVYRYAEEYYSR